MLSFFSYASGCEGGQTDPAMETAKKRSSQVGSNLPVLQWGLYGRVSPCHLGNAQALPPQGWELPEVSEIMPWRMVYDPPRWTPQASLPVPVGSQPPNEGGWGLNLDQSKLGLTLGTRGLLVTLKGLWVGKTLFCVSGSPHQEFSFLLRGCSVQFKKPVTFSRGSLFS